MSTQLNKHEFLERFISEGKFKNQEEVYTAYKQYNREGQYPDIVIINVFENDNQIEAGTPVKMEVCFSK